MSDYIIKATGGKAYAELKTESIITKTIEQLEPELKNINADILILEKQKAQIEKMIAAIKAHK
uniref:Uncharacterized protein n=1 Tax=viral metagenome TaxID=1070528 RepID=A0A6M3XRR0_9ZZZZ